MKTLITGADGMVARAVAACCHSAGDRVFALARAEMDITNLRSVTKAVTTLSPDVIINCAAYTDVDGAELNPDASHAANADGVENLAIACKAISAGFVTISTDYVFDGTNAGFYTQR